MAVDFCRLKTRSFVTSQPYSSDFFSDVTSFQVDGHERLNHGRYGIYKCFVSRFAL